MAKWEKADSPSVTTLKAGTIMEPQDMIPIFDILERSRLVQAKPVN